MTAKNVFISGASSGIGREFALQLAPTSSSIYLCGRDISALNETKNLVLQTNPQVKCELLPYDLTIAHQRDELVSRIRGLTIDMAVLNAGGGNFEKFANSDIESDTNTVELNVTSTVTLAKALLPKLISEKTRRGGIIFVSSHASFMRIPRFSVYSACKAFINHFALTLVQEYADDPVDILVVCPGATRTKFSLRAGLPQKMLSEPMSPAEVARRALSALGRQNFLVITFFDRILWIASRLLPRTFFDRVVTLLQTRLLKNTSLKKELL